MPPIDMKCLKCSADADHGELWTVEGKLGFLCKQCEEKTRSDIFRRYDEAFSKFGIPQTSLLMERNYKGIVRCGGGDGPSWVVRCAPLRPGPCWTVAVLPEEKIANTFAAFWGSFVYTEVRVIRVEPGNATEGPALDRWEQGYLSLYRPPIRPKPKGPTMLRPRLATPPRRDIYSKAI